MVGPTLEAGCWTKREADKLMAAGKQHFKQIVPESKHIFEIHNYYTTVCYWASAPHASLISLCAEHAAIIVMDRQ